MAIKKSLIYVHILGQGINETFRAVSHEVMGFPAGTYHKFVMEDGTDVYFNDFGVRSVKIADRLEKLS